MVATVLFSDKRGTWAPALDACASTSDISVHAPCPFRMWKLVPGQSGVGLLPANNPNLALG